MRRSMPAATWCWCAIARMQPMNCWAVCSARSLRRLLPGWRASTAGRRLPPWPRSRRPNSIARRFITSARSAWKAPTCWQVLLRSANVADDAHRHHDHRHVPGSRQALIVALVVTLGYGLVEFVAGAAFHSLALMSDAGHMLSDALALGLAAFASWVGSRPAGTRHSYGFARAEVVAAFVNGLAMLLIVVVIAVEAISRLLDPQPVTGLGVMVVAIVGLLANLFVAFLIGRGERNLNTRAALIHVVGDLIGSVAAITAGAAVFFFRLRPTRSFVWLGVQAV